MCVFQLLVCLWVMCVFFSFLCVYELCVCFSASCVFNSNPCVQQQSVCSTAIRVLMRHLVCSTVIRVFFSISCVLMSLFLSLVYLKFYSIIRGVIRKKTVEKRLGFVQWLRTCTLKLVEKYCSAIKKNNKKNTILDNTIESDA